MMISHAERVKKIVDEIPQGEKFRSSDIASQIRSRAGVLNKECGCMIRRSGMAEKINHDEWVKL